ncbi:MAG: ABC transporter ATP-binding protein [Alphaproteobacteria bacterium]|nr:ABC transporter ATP-binding protein [Alphaproteobacteria bacterium]
MNKIALSIKDVSVTYTDKPVIDDINLEIKHGETFGLIGLNGAGKTTLIKCILALRNQNKGEILINGKSRDKMDSKFDLAYLPEKFEPPWFLTGAEFIKFSLSLYKRKITDQDIIEAAEAVALDKAALKRKVNTYSKGMRQKLGLIATMLTNCDVLIFDEPMSGLDPQARALVKRMMTDIKHKDKTIFLSSHILADMDEICDRIAVLYDSHICYIGPPKKLKEETFTDNLEHAFLDFIERRQVM